MVKLKIDKIEYSVPEGSTVFNAALNAGYKIPALCYDSSLPHYSSCMVCMVKDRNNYIPSCSALVQEGMDIDVSSDEVLSIRYKAIDLLLSEHRAECEAPCRVVCPGGYNIPQMNRLIKANEFEAAIKLSLSASENGLIKCYNCPGYCENACRRKKIDIPVSIRNLQLFVFQIADKDNLTDKQHISKEVSGEVSVSLPKKRSSFFNFSSRTGMIEPSELQEWLKECSENVQRSVEITDLISASWEAAACMHCDCRASDDCKLRKVAEEYSVKDPRGKLVNAPIEKKINYNTGLIFENAKCIKCGLCVRLAEKLNEEPALCFINRGFSSIISEPLTEEFSNILGTRSREFIDICPTGALSGAK